MGCAMTWKSAPFSPRARPSTPPRRRLLASSRASRAIPTMSPRGLAWLGIQKETARPSFARDMACFTTTHFWPRLSTPTADGGRSVQLISTGGTPSACGLVTPACGNGLDTPANLNGSSIFQGVLNALPNMIYLPNQQRFNPLASGSIFANQAYLQAGFPLPILPFTLPISKNFVYAYA